MFRIVIVALFSSVMLNAFGLSNLVSAVSGATTSSSSSKSGGSGKCIARNAGGSTTMTQLVAKKLLSLVISKALEKAQGTKDIQLPTAITNTCEADKRLKYLQKVTNAFQGNIDGANKDILSSVEQTKEIQTLQEEIAHKKKSLDEAEYKDGVIEDNSKLLGLIKNAKVKDRAKYSAALGRLAIATPTDGYMVLGWDKEILEFAKDNMVWGIKNAGAIKTISSQLITTIKILPTLSSLVTSPLYNGKVDKKIAKKAARAAIKSDKKIAADAENEMDETDS